MENNNPFNDTIDALKNTSKQVDEFTRKQDAKESSEPVNESKENTNPSFILYDSIATSSISLLEDNAVVNTFKKISESIGEETSKNLVELLVITMTQSAYNAIIFYDQLLKKELDTHFKAIANNMNILKADTDAHHEVLKVFKKQLGEIQNKSTLEEFKNDNHITSDPNNN